jgi:hypothetical protein
MPEAHNIWQLGQWALPSIFTRHSKQIPIPHNTLRGCPDTEVRQNPPTIATATATLVPSETEIAAPFMVSEILSGTGSSSQHA